MFDEYAMGDAHYAVGVGTQTQSLIYYNKTAFEKAGISGPPTTWDELTTDLGALEKAGYTPMQTAGDFQTGLQLQQIYHPTLNQLHPKWQTAVADDRLSVGDAYKPAFQMYADWIEAGYIGKSDVGLSPPRRTATSPRARWVSTPTAAGSRRAWTRPGTSRSRWACSPRRPRTVRPTRARRAPPWPTPT